MTESPRIRSRGLFVLAVLMAVSIVGLIGLAAASQHPTSLVATFEAYSADGTQLWTVETDIDGTPQLIADSVQFHVRGERSMLIASGQIVPYRAPTPSPDVVAVGEVDFMDSRSPGDQVLIVRDADGQELWRAEGANLVDAFDSVAVIRSGNSFFVVAARTGEVLHEARPARNRSPVAGPGAVVYTSEGALTVVTLDDVTTFAIEGLERGARVVKVDDGAAAVEDASGSRVLRGYDLESGEQLWSRSSIPQAWDAAVYFGHGTPIDQNTRTGNAGGVWTTVAGPDGASASLATVLELSVEAGVRYLLHGPTTTAVDQESGRVLWSGEMGRFMAAAGGAALFDRGDTFAMLDASTGRILAEAPRARGSSAAIGAGNLLFNDGANVILEDGHGDRRLIATIAGNVRVKAVNERYGVLVVANELGRRLAVYDLESGERVINQRMRPVIRVRFDGETIHVLHGERSETSIDLRSAAVVRIGEPEVPFEDPATGVAKIAAVFDASRQRIMWETPLADQAIAGVMRDLIIVVRIGSRDGRSVEYPEP